MSARLLLLANLLAASAAPSFLASAAPPVQPDPRNFANGHLVPVESYCDQPRIVVTRDGSWVCILTTGPGVEGAEGQHVVSTFSQDKGRTWSRLFDIEPPDKERASAYALALITPADRIYAFYCYNGDAIRTLPDGRPIRADMQGWLCFRYSEDNGQTWSERHRITMPITAADRTNDWSGRLQMWWAIGTPAIFDGKVIFGFTRLGKYILHGGEGWFCRSDNILTETHPAKIKWRFLPEGDYGVRTPEFGSVQEEFDVVHLENQDLFCVYRTTLGHAASAYSRNGGLSWTKPDALRYTPGGRPVKQPRACAKIWKTHNGRFLLWFHNNGTTTYNNGPNAGSRNLAWLSAGRLQDGFIHWSQPEIVAYVEGGLEGCSYPDLIEDEDRYYICATQKTEARVMELHPALLPALWQQDSADKVVTNSLVLSLRQPAPGQADLRAPRLPTLGGDVQRRTARDDAAGGFTIDVALRFTSLAPGQIILDTRDDAGRGYVLRTADRNNVRLEFSDGWQAAFWESDPYTLGTNSLHHIVAIVDGRARVICFVVDGILNDGGTHRQFGYGRFGPNFKQVSGSRLQLGVPLNHLRIYDRPLLTSEAIANFNTLR